MNCCKIRIEGSDFLLPENKSEYDFPPYILEHELLIRSYIQKINAVFVPPQVYSRLNEIKMPEELDHFIQITGIIGFPFTMHVPDVEMYALNNGWTICLEFDFDENAN